MKKNYKILSLSLVLAILVGITIAILVTTHQKKQAVSTQPEITIDSETPKEQEKTTTEPTTEEPTETTTEKSTEKPTEKPKPQQKPQSKPKPQPKPQAKPESKPQQKPESKPESETKPTPEPTQPSKKFAGKEDEEAVAMKEELICCPGLFSAYFIVSR